MASLWARKVEEIIPLMMLPLPSKALLPVLYKTSPKPRNPYCERLPGLTRRGHGTQLFPAGRGLTRSVFPSVWTLVWLRTSWSSSRSETSSSSSGVYKKKAKHCWWKCKMVTRLAVHQKGSTELSIRPSNSTPRYICKQLFVGNCPQ